MIAAVEIRAAQARIHPFVRRTPLLRAPLLDELAGRRVWVKAECLQWTGSFKYRGASNALARLEADAAARGVLAYSSGNHAQGVALAARERGISATIIMPSDAPKAKIDATRAYGAQVMLYDRALESREEIGARLAAQTGARLIRPYDDADVIAGQASVGLELAEDAKLLGMSSADVLVCCGGGGLSAGIALALATEAPRLRVRTVEPSGFDDMARSLAAGRRLENAARSGSICDAILTPMPGELTFPILLAHAGPGLVVSDAEARHAVALAAQHLKLVLEPGGAVALAAAVHWGRELSGDDVIVVASGGNIDPGLFAACLQESAAP